MNQSTAILRLADYDQRGRYIYTQRDLAKIFPEDSKQALQAGINRLVKNGLLIRAVRDVYVFALSQNIGSNTLEVIVKTMRRGEYSYVSLESALSEYGAISQVPIDRLTVVTTGRSGEFKTPWGTIEFTHTKCSVFDIVSNIRTVGRPLRIATLEAAYRDMRRVGRNTHLVKEQIVYE